MKTYAQRTRRPRSTGVIPPLTDTRGFADLHRAVGNRAVARMLAEPGATPVLQRWFGGWRLPVPARAEPSFTATCSLEGDRLKGTFPIEAFNWGAQTGGKAAAKDFSVVKRADSLSTKLLQAAADGTRIATVKIVLSKGSTTITYVFKDVYVAAVRRGTAASEPVPLEEVLFSFGSVSYGSEAAKGGSANDTAVRDWSYSGPPG